MRKMSDWKENIKRIINLLEKNNAAKVVVIAGLNENALQKEFAVVLAEGIKERNKRVGFIDVIEKQDTTGSVVEKVEKELFELKEKNDYVIINNLCIASYAAAVAVCAFADETILVIESGTINGNRAMELKRELDMNGVHVLGSIFIK